ncbi:hypothetical protein BDM02DRAFT_2453423 [Thelephora ganbajun]|uniref:Uncharacterized protein n=1 Tax=Thelephora ganbajun TaxID=370292 RepID=A0ACB6ZF61_THEGA|nr:hypothetical protein BDM02DRAFT_2453423 [Thelephora ganbajun]
MVHKTHKGTRYFLRCRNPSSSDTRPSPHPRRSDMVAFEDTGVLHLTERICVYSDRVRCSTMVRRDSVAINHRHTLVGYLRSGVRQSTEERERSPTQRVLKSESDHEVRGVSAHKHACRILAHLAEAPYDTSLITLNCECPVESLSVAPTHAEFNDLEGISFTDWGVRRRSSTWFARSLSCICS